MKTAMYQKPKTPTNGNPGDGGNTPTGISNWTRMLCIRPHSTDFAWSHCTAERIVVKNSNRCSRGGGATWRGAAPQLQSRGTTSSCGQPATEKCCAKSHSLPGKTRDLCPFLSSFKSTKGAVSEDALQGAVSVARVAESESLARCSSGIHPANDLAAPTKAFCLR
ncbi:predicted protein [Plenodomus lingam JN3]|uniref:Uncharacterized protein n=1 Tax=Leptosphaeria maculans (strain JN3 / isolate v23.1.3 / race Av1-4-5-6-7-8) TaxID=985895 RepID=E4ZG82_LEPMJ|nr:predicted protein [Plenodomus lingam JN3]CBX90302.1 predicted protein [Plenodomus lingam JN3]